MTMNINPKVKEIEISGIRKFFNMISGKDNIVSLTLGQPNFDTPQHIKDAAIKAINNNTTRYTHNAGFMELREATSNWMKKKYQLSYQAEDEIIITAGSSEAIDIALRALLTTGDEVILPAPVYPGYEPVITMCGAKTVLVDTTETNFKLTATQLTKHLTKNTKVVILPYPSNPTGAILTEQELKDLAQCLKDKDVVIIADELYSELVFEGNHKSIANYENMREKTIIINGLSKSHAMTGWRVGILLAPSYLANQILKVHQYNVTCASSVSQIAALEALTNGYEDAYPMRDSYYERIEYTWKRLNDMGLKTHKPGGAFYIFTSIKHLGVKSFDMALRLVEEAGVALIPGDAFSQYGEGYLRISCAVSMESLVEGLNRIEEFLSKL
ncbi:aminotransferase A [Clostridium sp. 'deep sea']|uniref:aminotransferase A n=1 Tax=Clostridium sp. 'deep sea' TaxID=2779445 RepID=UPI0018964893|nr:aminotransferase A [Clostridium sp. 'deep sea']QOR34697.1 aminotransferase A [Clostridium sp. 'deep sea']